MPYFISKIYQVLFIMFKINILIKYINNIFILLLLKKIGNSNNISHGNGSTATYE